MTFTDDLNIVTSHVGYLHAPGSHHTTTRIVPAARLFQSGHKNRLSHGKPVIKRLLHEIRQEKNRLVRSRYIDKVAVRALHDKICATMKWNLRGLLDRIGELDRPGSFLITYIQHGPICSRKPEQPVRGASKEIQIQYKKEKDAWTKDDKKGLKLLKNVQTHIHEITFASWEMNSLVELYRTLEYKNLSGCIEWKVAETIARVSKWIHERFLLLEINIKDAVRCTTYTQNSSFHEYLQTWRKNKTYIALKAFLLKKYIGFYNKNEQEQYLHKINKTDSLL